jgi:hypothetical protein
MHLNLPPLIPYMVGALLVVFGIVRVKVLGAPRPPRSADGDEAQAAPMAESPVAEPADVRGPEQKRHIRWGVLWVLMGLFLLISTFIQTHRQP